MKTSARAAANLGVRNLFRFGCERTGVRAPVGSERCRYVDTVAASRIGDSRSPINFSFRRSSPVKNRTKDERAIVRWRTFTAFTLVELLVVIAIIGILATIGLPALKGFGKGTGMAGAERQLLQDLGLARLAAINGRTSVYMVFVPTNVHALLWPTPITNDAKILKQLTNLVTGQYTTYALVTRRTVGDQPGRETPRYISEWKSLPQGILIATNKFDQVALSSDPSLVSFLLDYKRALPANEFPFPNGKSPKWPLPYIAFNSQGQLESRHDELIPLAEGSIFYAKNSQGQLAPAPPDVVIKPPYNYTNHFIRINK
ncbi:MAG: prepilin-type N-terminal cleavage/methylation domain-containing protein [Verrucomicrobia bacterium]|nr:MAG: prepilin-type N-terminal cleavage/methylation domain-containing protein [Verrucomicrobiota bacterium]